MTRVEKFEVIKKMLINAGYADEESAISTFVEDPVSYITFLEEEMEKIKRRNSKSSKPTKKQLINLSLKDKLFETMEAGKSYRVAELAALLGIDDEGKTVSPQRVTSLLKHLKEENKVEKTMEKKIVYYIKTEVGESTETPE